MPYALLASLTVSILLIINRIQIARSEHSSREDRRRVKIAGKSLDLGGLTYVRTVPGKHRMGGHEKAHARCSAAHECSFWDKSFSQVRAIAYIKRARYELEYELRMNTTAGLLCGYSPPPTSLPGLSKPSGSRHALRPLNSSMPTEPISRDRKRAWSTPTA